MARTEELQRPFDLVDAKLAEADFFLAKIEEAGPNVFEVRCYFSAFVSAARSVSFALQAVLHVAEGFADWYEARRIVLRQDAVCSYFVERRNETLKTGETRINAGTLGRTPDGRLVARHFFSRSRDESEAMELDVVTASRIYLGVLRDLVDEARRAFPKYADPDWYFVEANLKAEGLTIEDLEEMCGLPRGWTDGLASEDRLAALRGTSHVPMAESIGQRLLDND
jgi:hypothetical protein